MEKQIPEPKTNEKHLRSLKPYTWTRPLPSSCPFHWYWFLFSSCFCRTRPLHASPRTSRQWPTLRPAGWPRQSCRVGTPTATTGWSTGRRRTPGWRTTWRWCYDSACLTYGTSYSNYCCTSWQGREEKEILDQHSFFSDSALREGGSATQHDKWYAG